jgi:hypothetical protein
MSRKHIGRFGPAWQVLRFSGNRVIRAGCVLFEGRFASRLRELVSIFAARRALS